MKNYIHEVYIHAVISAEKLNELINSELDKKKANLNKSKAEAGLKTPHDPAPPKFF